MWPEGRKLAESPALETTLHFFKRRNFYRCTPKQLYCVARQFALDGKEQLAVPIEPSAPFCFVRRRDSAFAQISETSGGIIVLTHDDNEPVFGSELCTCRLSG